MLFEAFFRHFYTFRSIVPTLWLPIRLTQMLLSGEKLEIPSP